MPDDEAIGARLHWSSTLRPGTLKDVSHDVHQVPITPADHEFLRRRVPQRREGDWLVINRTHGAWARPKLHKGKVVTLG